METYQIYSIFLAFYVFFALTIGISYEIYLYITFVEYQPPTKKTKKRRKKDPYSIKAGFVAHCRVCKQYLLTELALKQHEKDPKHVNLISGQQLPRWFNIVPEDQYKRAPNASVVRDLQSRIVKEDNRNWEEVTKKSRAKPGRR